MCCLPIVLTPLVGDVLDDDDSARVSWHLNAFCRAFGPVSRGWAWISLLLFLFKIYHNCVTFTSCVLWWKGAMRDYASRYFTSKKQHPAMLTAAAKKHGYASVAHTIDRIFYSNGSRARNESPPYRQDKEAFIYQPCFIVCLRACGWWFFCSCEGDSDRHTLLVAQAHMDTTLVLRFSFDYALLREKNVPHFLASPDTYRGEPRKVVRRRQLFYIRSCIDRWLHFYFYSFASTNAIEQQKCRLSLLLFFDLALNFSVRIHGECWDLL